MENFTHSDLTACIPRLRGFARGLTRNSDRADDLVQDTIVRALTAADRFQAGTNLQAWMFAILRNLYYTDLRHYRRRVWPQDGGVIPEPSVPPSQEHRLAFNAFARAFSQLSNEHRDVLTLIGIDGLSYAEAAGLCACPVGTIKSRVSRARLTLRRMLDQDAPSTMQRDRPAAPPPPASRNDGRALMSLSA